MDVFTREKRSDVMSRIRSSGNETTELALARFFRKHGIRGWRCRARLFGKPDFVFRGVRIAVFVDGCFWHGCPAHGGLPTTNRAFWRKKLDGNRARDKLVARQLRRGGWKVIRIWQHDMRPCNEIKLMRLLKPLICPCERKQADVLARRRVKPENTYRR